MRTTLTLDEDLDRELKRIARLTDRSFKQVVNETLRKGLTEGDAPSPTLPPFRVEPKACGFLPGVDVFRLNRLNDELEVEDLRRELQRDLATAKAERRPVAESERE